MITIFVNTQTGLVDHLQSYRKDTFVDGQAYGDVTAYNHDTVEAPMTILTTWHWESNTSSFDTHPIRPSDDYVWDKANAIWIVDDITTVCDSNYNTLKSELYRFITETSNFPEWKQVNYSDTYSELSIQKLTNGITTDQQTTLDNIVAVRAWKNALLSERDRVKTLIYDATNLAGITTAVDSLVYSTPPFEL